MNAVGRPLSNRDLWENIIYWRTQYANHAYSLEVKWVKSHDNVRGSEEANKLAIAGVMNRSPYGGGRGTDVDFIDFVCD